MVAFLLARMGVEVVVLEKHKDFLRDFRGDTIHPSTLELMYELGFLEEFLQRPHQEIRQISGQVGKHTFTIGDFTHLSTKCKFLALMPQWDFLTFICDHAQRYPGFRVMMEAEVSDLIIDNSKVVGVIAKTLTGTLEVRSNLTIGADGRRSTVRQRASLQVDDLGAPMDVLWMRISRQPSDSAAVFGHVEAGRMLVLINRDQYWQCAYLIPKGMFDALKQGGIERLRTRVAELAPFLSDRVNELKTWDDISVLTVRVDRLEQWSKPGLLCIGDAAHAMSPIGGVGINLAIQDAVATANLLGSKLLTGGVTPDDLAAVQERREFPTKATQRMQVLIQDRVIRRILGAQQPIHPPLLLRVVSRLPVLQRVPARIIGMGFRPEHIHTPDTQ